METELYEKDYYYSTSRGNVGGVMPLSGRRDTVVVCAVATGGFQGVPYCTSCGQCYTCFLINGNSGAIASSNPDCASPAYAHSWTGPRSTW